jgi:hypothetical protein
MYFKQGSCSKGAKCKFSHDLAIERKAEKRSLYDDLRENGGDKENGLLRRKERNFCSGLCLCFQTQWQIGMMHNWLK